VILTGDKVSIASGRVSPNTVAKNTGDSQCVGSGVREHISPKIPLTYCHSATVIDDVPVLD